MDRLWLRAIYICQPPTATHRYPGPLHPSARAIPDRCTPLLPRTAVPAHFTSHPLRHETLRVANPPLHSSTMAQHRLIADLHLHSRYSLATSPQLNIETLATTATRKGIDLLAAPDFTHPVWRQEMRNSLEPAGSGVFRRRDQQNGPTFLLTTEIACIWRHQDRSRRVHVLLMAPSFDAAEKISATLANYQNLESDGRPMIKLSAEDLYSAALDADNRCVLFPAHVWTPWYGVYGSKSGFDSLEECFGEHTNRVPAVETGLSSNPHMNWAVSDISNRAIVSFSDAHSPATMGRELTVLDAESDYESVRSALFENRVVETIEFHPEHGKYHMNGHRKCDVKLSSEETPPDGRCPVCHRPLTLGVLHRVNQLADSAPEPLRLEDGLLHGSGPNNRPFRQLVPLRELISQAVSAGVGTKKVSSAYSALVDYFKTELNVLISASEDDLARIAGDLTAEMIIAVREGRVHVEAGFDGVYGTVSARF